MTTPSLPHPKTLTNSPQINRLDRLTNWLLAAIVAIPFFISFGALKHLAAANGVSYPVLYPLMVDGGLIIFKLLALRHSLRGKRDAYTWGMAISLTVISVFLNVVHVPAEITSLGLARFMAALPPLVILAAFIAVSRRIEEAAKLEGAVIRYEQVVAWADQKRQEMDEFLAKKDVELANMVAKKTAELTKLTQQIEQLAGQKANLQADITELRWTKNGQNRANTDSIVQARAARLTKKEQAIAALLTYLNANPDATQAEIANEIGRSRSTVGNYLAELSDAGRLHKNGQGWEVYPAQ